MGAYSRLGAYFSEKPLPFSVTLFSINKTMKEEHCPYFIPSFYIFLVGGMEVGSFSRLGAFKLFWLLRWALTVNNFCCCLFPFVHCGYVLVCHRTSLDFLADSETFNHYFEKLKVSYHSSFRFGKRYSLSTF